MSDGNIAVDRSARSAFMIVASLPGSNALDHILIIEDEPMIALAIQVTLEDEGVTSFDLAVTEAEAVALAADRPPTFITSDVALLEGTGPRAVAAILARHGTIPVLFLTGNPEDCVPVTPPAVVLTKPVRRTPGCDDLPHVDGEAVRLTSVGLTIEPRNRRSYRYGRGGRPTDNS